MDVRNSRGKFDEINGKFAINPVPIASQLSLNTGDHDELEIFLKICLIYFMNRSKVRFQRENTSLFNENFEQKFPAV